jgi:hypothetical protein
MKIRNTSATTRRWRDRFLEIARQAEGGGTAPGLAMGLRLRLRTPAFVELRRSRPA